MKLKLCLIFSFMFLPFQGYTCQPFFFNGEEWVDLTRKELKLIQRDRYCSDGMMWWTCCQCDTSNSYASDTCDNKKCRWQRCIPILEQKKKKKPRKSSISY